MGKSRCFLGIFASLFIAFFVTHSALAAGYSCPSYKKYTSCAEGYYISNCGTSDNTEGWEHFNENGGVPTTELAPGNSCVACPTSSISSPGVKYVCAGGLMCPENVNILVSFDENGGSLPSGTSLVDRTCTKGEPCTLIRGTYIYRAGYVMVGWSLDQNATEGDFTMTFDEGGSATVYAVWQPCARGTYKTASSGGEDACEPCSGNEYSDTEGASECKWARKGYYTVCDQGGPNGTYCTGEAQCTGANYCSNGYIEPCPEPESGWIAGTGEGWSSFRDCFEYRNATDISEYCATGSLKKYGYSVSYWEPNVRVDEKFMAAPGGYVTGSGEDLNCAACPAGYRDGAGAVSESECVGEFTRNGVQNDPSLPANCSDMTLGTCSPESCQYTKKYGTAGNGAIVSDCESVEELSCTKPITQLTAGAKYYVNGVTSCPACPAGYPNSDGGTDDVTQCYSDSKTRDWNGSKVDGNVPANCSGATWGDCPADEMESCTYVAYANEAGTGDGTIKSGCSTNNATCTRVVATVTADSGYYDAGTTCTACSSVGDGTYTLSDDGNDGGNTKCYKTCTRQCDQQQCPANATCTHGTQTTPGREYYGDTCDAAPSTCTLEFTCNAGYKKNSSGTGCEAETYTITYKNGGGTGADESQNVIYLAQFTTKPATTFVRPGYTFTSWGDPFPNPNSQYQYNETSNTTLTAQWNPCEANPTTGEGTCDCGTGNYPNGSGCSNCVVQCTGVTGYTLGSYNVCDSETDGLCYRACATSDVANSSEVSGTGVFKNGTVDCEATACKENFYLSGRGCAACVPNATCPGGDEPFKCDTGFHLSDDGTSCERNDITITLDKNGGTGTVNGTGGTANATFVCKYGAPCTLPDGAGLIRTNYEFTGWGTTPDCESGTLQEIFTAKATRYACWSQTVTQCQPGKYYNGSEHVACPDNMFCPGSGSVAMGTAGCGTTCPDGGKTNGDATTNTQCFVTCPVKSIDNGTITADSSTVNFDGEDYPTCTYTVNCNAGYLATNQGSANPTCEPCGDGVVCPGGTDDSTPEQCAAGDYCEDGIAHECPTGGTSDAGAGAITDCYNPCTETISVDHATSVKSDGKKNYDGAKYPACTYTVVCETDYTASGNGTASPSCLFSGDCPAGHYCPTGGGEPQQCPMYGDVDGVTADAGATEATDCYVPCNRAGDITGGELTSNAASTGDKSYWNGSGYTACLYTANCNPGYVAVNQNSATATCEICAAGENCPGGTDDTEPGDCPEGSYCEQGKGPQTCPDGGLSAAGSDELTDCYKTCPTTIDVANAIKVVSNGNAMHKGGSADAGYNECTYNVTCDDGFVVQNNNSTQPSCVWDDPNACPEGSYCPPESDAPIACPDGGTTDGGATSVTQCYKVFTDYVGFSHGKADAKCNYQTSTSKYDYCNVIQPVKSCDAGYYYQNGMGCSNTDSGYYSPAGDVTQTACPRNPTGGAVASTANADSYADCYMTCAIDVDNASSVSADKNTVYGTSADEYEACSFAVTCNTGYTVNDNNSAAPSCQANEYTITLNKNGGVGSVADSIECVFDSGVCALPANSGLNRPGYNGENKWCTRADGSGTCYDAGQNVDGNISAKGTDMTLYAVWTPNVYTITLDSNGADVAGAPTTVYLKYANGWFSNAGATTPIETLTASPTKDGYEFIGYYSQSDGGVQVVSADGAFRATDEVLTFTTAEPTTVYARWSEGTTPCDAGTYYTGSGTTCAPCDPNHYCPGGNFGTDSGSAEGLNACPDGGLSVGGSDSITACYKTKLEYTATHGSGTQTCDWDDSAKSYSAKCRDIDVVQCDAGYWRESDDAVDCAVVGTGFYSGADVITRTACPNNGTTDTDVAKNVQECFRTGLEYRAEFGAGTQRCFYSRGDGASAVYERECDTQVIETCWAGYYLASPTDVDCSVVTKGYYSDVDDIERHACPAGGTTYEDNAGSITRCNKDGQPYTDALHGAGERTCFYTSGTGDDAIYSSECENITMTSCEAGYWYDTQQTTTDCVEVGKNYYSPAVEMSRHECPLGGVTDGTTSAAASECYRTDMACDIENGSGQQTCNYNESGGDYSLDCQTCYVTVCDEGFSQVDNTCINCPADNVCTDGKQETCYDLTRGTYTKSDPGTTDVAMCYRDCAVSPNAATMGGRDYFGPDVPDTCEITRCLAGYTLENGRCVECPAGSFCDGAIDPVVPGDDVQSCADLGDGSWTESAPNAADAGDCYQMCDPYEVVNGTAVPVEEKAYWPNECEYKGESTTGNPCEIIDGVCIETSCDGGYEMIDGVCEPCERENAITYKDTGVCQVASCTYGYHPNGDQCEYDIQECELPNAVYAEREWNYRENKFGACVPQECESGFHVANNACVTDVQPCNVEHGTGLKEWNHDTNDWGECVAMTCNPGYTSDPTQSNEPTKPCGECRNKYGALGRQVVSSYAQECEIASCMYQGELYNLENGECVQICPFEEYTDPEGTGTMVWDEGRKKCVRTCAPGYTLW